MNSNEKKGIFISFEGGEGCGKSTQIKILYKYLLSYGLDVELIREPGSTHLGEKIRNILLNIKDLDICAESELLLYEAARAQIVKEKIIPALESGKVVLCDRYIDSSYAYQGYGRGLNLDIIDKLNAFACKNIIPDKTIYLRVTTNIGLFRATGSNLNDADRIESEGLQFHSKVSEGFEKKAQQENHRFVIIDTAEEKFDTQLKIFESLQALFPQIEPPSIDKINDIVALIKQEKNDR
ncbi:MAG: dTMP kinase [Coriobacteriales bacterium]|nr:dTMP kinase [Coriobacteriales bacterium]